MATRSKVLGFVLHFGYVESSRIGNIFLRHIGGGFKSVPDALTHLADYLMEDYLISWIGFDYDLKPIASYGRGKPNLEQFQHYLDLIPFSVASAGIGEESFDSCHVNDEEWWPWDQLNEVYPYLDRYYENTETPLSAILCFYLTPTKIPDEDLKKEVTDLQNGDHQSWMTTLKDHKKTFRPVAKKKARRS